MCHENEMGAAKEQHPYIICRLDKQRRWNSGGTVTRPLFTAIIMAGEQYIHQKKRGVWMKNLGFCSQARVPAPFLRTLYYTTP